jgi:signal-transduction protein with cAMP-binding, CBS, and nucleotidyltransferase domain
LTPHQRGLAETGFTAMKDWHSTFVSPEDSILMALAALDRGGMQIVLVVDSERHLLGVVTDGDIRKHILRGGSLALPIAPLMNSRPTKNSVLSASLHSMISLPRGFNQIWSC